MPYELTCEDYRILYDGTVLGLRKGPSEGVTPVYVNEITDEDFDEDLGCSIWAQLRDGRGGYLSVNIRSPLFALTPPPLGMILLPSGRQAAFVKRLDNKQYRRGLVTEALRVILISEKESLGLDIAHKDFSGGVTPAYAHGLFNRKVFGYTEALQIIEEGGALSLPIDYHYAVRIHGKSNRIYLNKDGLDVAYLNVGRKMVLGNGLIQLREQIEALGIELEGGDDDS